MLEYRVLYYPDFSPASTWLRRVLMLSDKVIRIVPSDVTPEDSRDLLRLQDAIPGCLTAVAPDQEDVAIEPGEQYRLRHAFELLGKKSEKGSAKITVTVSNGGRFAVAGHVFIHNRKLSHFVEHELRRNGLLMETFSGLAPRPFMLVRKEASDIILAGLASRMARRLGVDAITDRPMPFAIGALQGVPQRAADSGAAEGALLSAIATLMIPTSVANITARQYREIRESYAGIREAFKVLTAELAVQHRLGRVVSSNEFASRVSSVACEFAREYREYRSSRYVKRFKSWAPLCITGILSVPAALVSPLAATGMAVTGFAIQLLAHLDKDDRTADQRVFQMLAGLRRDVIKRSGIGELI